MERFKDVFGSRKSKEAAASPKDIMNDEMFHAVQGVRAFILKYKLSKDLKAYDAGDLIPLKKSGYYALVYYLHDLQTMMNPDYAWYEKEISFDNGYEASIMCTPMTCGSDEKLFEVGVYKPGEKCDDTDVCDVQTRLTFRDVVETLHTIHDLPPAEKDDVGSKDPEQQQNEKQEEANPYEVPPGPI